MILVSLETLSKKPPLQAWNAKWWEHVTLTYEEIASIAGVPIDHSFLTFKKELLAYGYKVGKILMKNQTVEFIKEA